MKSLWHLNSAVVANNAIMPYLVTTLPSDEGPVVAAIYSARHTYDVLTVSDPARAIWLDTDLWGLKTPRLDWAKQLQLHSHVDQVS